MIRIENLRLQAREYYTDDEWRNGEDVQLHDGKIVQLIPGRKTHIPSVQGSSPYNINLQFLNKKTILSELTFLTIFKGLSKFSTDYIRLVSKVTGDAFRQRIFDVKEPISLKNLDNWCAVTPLSYWPFLKFYLFQLTQTMDNRVIDEELRKFILDPETRELNDDGAGPYFALLTNDPDRGALTEQELKSIQAGLNKGYLSGDVAFEDYVVTWFQIGTGVRPIQTARMKNKHVIIQDGPAGLGREVTLLVPLAKDTQGKTSGYIRRRAPSVLADILIRYQTAKNDPDPEESLFGLRTSTYLNVRLSAVFRRIITYSNRTKGPIHITPYRFRYTLATRAVAQGATDAQVARLLTHKDTNSIKHYRASLANNQAPINEALGEEMDFFAGVFSGKIINDFDEATNSGDYNKLIRDFERLTGKKIGACGARSTCYQDAPRACLTCFKFEPFVDAHWGDLERVIQAEYERESDSRIKQIHLDQLNAVHSIKNACAAKMKLLEGAQV
ncbi:site-specific integrase [Labrenzia sp. PO1]|uniref:site-specific integrase n=1 Tax=Labrenzia sp. PO1 TaxID=2720390 RepID=UPI0014488CAD|nr:site-specific integrase [Labrenzia sp. PO1]NKI59629.1 site-specific integrase [Labrenzia sp. PO1]